MTAEAAHDVREMRDDVARSVTQTFLRSHPDWVERYGDAARERGEEDARHHLDFLAAAVELGEPRAFSDYVRWCRDVLESRQIASAALAENLEAISAELRQRLAPALAAVATTTVEAALSELTETPSRRAASTEPSLSLACHRYTDAAIAGRRRDALAIAREAIRSGDSLLDVYTSVFQAALYEVGRRWETAALTVAQEHTATATTQYVLSVLYDEMPAPVVERGNAVVTGVAGELHQIGANIVADALEADGWDVRFLGTNMPLEGILQTIDEHQPTLVGISTTIVANLHETRELITALRARDGETPFLLVGGRPFREYPHLAREVGADAFAADVGAAVEFARSA